MKNLFATVERLKARWVLVLLVLAGALNFSNGLHNGFMIDDHAFFDEKSRNIKYILYQFIPDKERVLGLREQKGDSYYRPLAHVVPMLTWLAFRDDVRGFHAVNIILLVIACFSMYWFITRLTQNKLLGLLTALMYLVHPINGVMVNYITASIFSVQVICMILSLAFLVFPLCNFIGGRVVAIVSSLFFFTMALFCHETAMALPFYAFVLFWLGMGQTRDAALKKSQPLFIFLGVYFLWRLSYASLGTSVLQKFGMFQMNPFEYLASWTCLAWWYISKLFYPAGIILIKALPVIRGGAVFSWGLMFLVLVGVFAYLFFALRANRWARLGLGLFAVNFLPYSFACLFQPAHGPMMEPHWFVFGVIGFFLLMACVIVDLTKRIRFEVWALVIALLLGSWVTTSRIYNWVWGNEIRYCFYWLKESPNFSSVQFYLAKAFEIHHFYPAARSWYNVVAKSGYKVWMVNTNLGLIDMIEGKWDDAKDHFAQALKYDGKLAIVQSNLGAIAFKEGKWDEAKHYFEEAVRIDRFLLLPRYNLYKVAMKQGRPQEAEAALKNALSIVPHDEIATVNLLLLYFDAKQMDKVWPLAEDLLSYSRNPNVMNNLIMLYKKFGINDKADQAYGKLKALSAGAQSQHD